ncbi:Cof-type HAD-IIB family hydrolase [Brochothrix campestris]|uniref:Cof hydrolase n=1 Tax=Brochothrix campestris FSL F6-1037 TaxID=1265861 RepID=W7CPL4_9LIST|nr:Cof-type HAD-IIB family hydrolase [Brochothrix campestris]EUJ34883.1 Cof hydrolase [Brochothrix campestris FSL F6-1037]
MTKIIFVDVDGTLCDRAGAVPLSAKQAIQATRATGNKVFVCTGRSKPEITAEIVGIGLDGIIGAGGGYVEIDGKVLTHKRMPKKAVLAIISYFEEHNIGYYLESNDGLFGSANCVASIQTQVTKGVDTDSTKYQELMAEFNWFYDILAQSVGRKIDYANVNKISFISNGHPFEAVNAQFQAEFEMHHTTVPQFGPESGEISVKGIDKQVAIRETLAHLGLAKEDAVAYGDGNNDLAMFAAVGYKVAMENGTEQLKKLADEITATAENDGIYQSFLKNKWL